MSATYTAPRERDAWFTIRGYVYQVDTTIARWLELQPSQELHLEAGEDIDRVVRSLASGAQLRDLEQIKYRAKAITLRSAPAVEAIANAIEHHQYNPSVTLFFYFTTNTKPGRERLSPFPKGISGIEVWEQIRTGAIKDSAVVGALSGIKTVLQNTRKPDDLNDQTWQTFSTFISTATSDDVLALVRSFTWSTQAPDAHRISDQIISALHTKGYAGSIQHAEAQYERLFLYVFKVLTERGLKRLTPEAREQQLSLPVLSEADRILLTYIKGVLGELELRVRSVEEQAVQHALTLALIQADMQRLAIAQGVNAAVTYTIMTPPMDIPPSVEMGSQRAETVARIESALEHHTWVALSGGAGAGKTQLAILVARRIDCRAWLGFRDLTVEQSCQRLDAAFQALAGEVPSPNRLPWYERLCQRLGTGTMVVLDDLPKLAPSDPLASRLVLLARACAGQGVRLLSTSCQVSHVNVPPVFTQMRHQAALTATDKLGG